MGSGPAVSGCARVLLADDHRLFREGVASLLTRVDDIELVGAAATGEEAILLAAELVPDVVLMDLNMPGLGGIEATRTILQRNPDVRIIVLTMLEDDESVFAALQAGAQGYVLKDAERGDLLRAIRAVARGEALIGAKLARRVLDRVSRTSATAPSGSDVHAPPPAQLTPPLDRLTARELEVLELIATGMRNRDIAAQLVITEKTVGNHISSIFTKLEVEDRVAAVLLARAAGIGPTPA